ncbi:NDP-hexose 2,3-dehydratase family protein [Plantactinospora sp. ZYX-F-223]|uniref:NDP-hexose 2,3-dehydratase family protein n=1 Tax=Plantactinospora sp. ZYX-F-223 TaxID=3144103 RepID=UPI0031FE3323
MPMDRFSQWFAQRAEAIPFSVSQIPFTELSGWRFATDTGNLVHDTGRFFSIEGLHVRTDREWIRSWTQPIIVQPEIGVLGILVKEFDGVLHCLMQAKMEPGNVNTVQLSPTVQATRSNYTGIHLGASIRYLEHFTGARDGRVIVDVLQSEQGSWFLHKRNRNMVVVTDDDVSPHEDYCWLTVGQLRRLLRYDHVVNMDTRTVMSCIPIAVPTAEALRGVPSGGDAWFARSVLDSFDPTAGSRHTTSEVLSWLTALRARQEFVQRRVPLYTVAQDGWLRGEEEISHRSGKHFRVIATAVQAGNREVTSWTQPLVAPIQPGLLAIIARRIDGVLHVLVQARVDAGSLNGAEMAPTVHCQPANYHGVPAEHRPRYLDLVLSADPSRIRYDVMQSEEGGRFFHAMNRYMVVEVDTEFPLDTSDEYRWMTLGQLTGLLAHSNYLNVELRSLIACIQSIW